MRVAVAGGTGLVGRHVVLALHRAGHEVTVLSRRPPAEGSLPPDVRHRAFDLGAAGEAPLAGADAVVHAALDHVPGRYRGGEGGDAPGFLSRNLGGTVGLFLAARDAGAKGVVFLSSRAVYGDHPPGTRLSEDLPLRPDTLYGHVKREAEAALARLSGPGFVGVTLRVTGVYGPAWPARAHKWEGLFDAFVRGDAIAPRVASEVHGDDVGAAVELCLGGALPPGVYNVSDIVLDRADLLTSFAALTGHGGPVPERADAAKLNIMTTDRLSAMGWRPRGPEGLAASLPEMCGPWMRSGRGA